MKKQTPTVDRDEPLLDDIRLLGKILGDIVREQKGKAFYSVAEQMTPAQLGAFTKKSLNFEARLSKELILRLNNWLLWLQVTTNFE